MTWIHDDPAIPHDQPLLRHVANQPSYITRDPVTGEMRLNPGALQFDADGMSVLHEPLLAPLAIEPLATRKSPQHGIARFPAKAPRDGRGGVVFDPTDEDPLAGPAHGLVRGAAPRLTKPEKQLIRNAISLAAEWVCHPEIPC